MSGSEIPIKTIERLSLYRRILQKELDKSKEYIFSYDLASLAHRKPDQIRRDLMALKATVSTKKGYRISDLIESMNQLLGSEEKQKMALIGVGNMGQALINFFKGRIEHLVITACFDVDVAKINRVISGCRCYSIDELKDVVDKEGITIGIITAPEISAQMSAERLIRAGVGAIINFAPVPLKSTHNVHIENLDLTTFFEKTAYFAKIHSKEKVEA